MLYADAQAVVGEKDWVALVRSVASGDQLALRTLYDWTHRLVYTLSVRITGDPHAAEEVTVDVFHDVWRRAGGYDPAGGSVVGWIMNQARSRAIDRVRFEQRKKRAEPDYCDPAMQNEPQNGHDLLVVKEENRAVQTALAVLTPGEKRAIEAAFFSELTHAEVATELKQPLGTVKTRIRSGLHKLKQALAAGKKE